MRDGSGPECTSPVLSIPVSSKKGKMAAKRIVLVLFSEDGELNSLPMGKHSVAQTGDRSQEEVTIDCLIYAASSCARYTSVSYLETAGSIFTKTDIKLHGSNEVHLDLDLPVYTRGAWLHIRRLCSASASPTERRREQPLEHRSAGALHAPRSGRSKPSPQHDQICSTATTFE